MTRARKTAAEEFDDMRRRFEREVEIPQRLKSIETWVADIKATPDDIRNKPDIQPNRRGGGTFVSGVTDLDVLLQSCAVARRYFLAGEFELSLSTMRGVESTVQAINARVTAPLIETGKAVRDGAKKGGPQKPDRDLQMAREFKRRRAADPTRKHQSDTALKADIGKKYKLKPRGANYAVDRGLKK